MDSVSADNDISCEGSPICALHRHGFVIVVHSCYFSAQEDTFLVLNAVVECLQESMAVEENSWIPMSVSTVGKAAGDEVQQLTYLLWLTVGDSISLTILPLYHDWPSSKGVATFSIAS